MTTAEEGRKLKLDEAIRLALTFACQGIPIAMGQASFLLATQPGVGGQQIDKLARASHPTPRTALHLCNGYSTVEVSLERMSRHGLAITSGLASSSRL